VKLWNPLSATRLVSNAALSRHFAQIAAGFALAGDTLSAREYVELAFLAADGDENLVQPHPDEQRVAPTCGS
jgi:hypothetical protein